MGFFSNKLILKGEEITFDYSFELFGYHYSTYLLKIIDFGDVNNTYLFFTKGTQNNKFVIVVQLNAAGLSAKSLDC